MVPDYRPLGAKILPKGMSGWWVAPMSPYWPGIDLWVGEAANLKRMPTIKNRR